MANGHGKYTEIVEEQFLPTVTKTRFVILHFYHKDFERCKIVDMHLEKIARVHTETWFGRIDAEKCPFFVSKLAVQMLPTVVCFMDGISIDRICGFDELGGVDDFPTLIMTRRLISAGVLRAMNRQERGDMKIKKAKNHYSSDDSD